MKDISLWPRQVIDIPARREYARLLREFAGGAITNREYEESSDQFTQRDTSVFAIHNQLTWFLYCDIATHRVVGKHRLTGNARTQITRSVLFLQTDAPADAWDDARNGKRTLLAIAAIVLTLPIWPVVVASLWLVHFVSKTERPSTPRNESWPFLSLSDFDAARHSPTFLAGA